MHKVKDAEELFDEVMKEIDGGILIYWRLKNEDKRT